MITPDQEQQWQQYQQQSGFKPAVSSTPSTYDAIDALVAQNAQQKQSALSQPFEKSITPDQLPGGNWDSLSFPEKLGVTAHNVIQKIPGVGASGTDIAGAIGGNAAADQSNKLAEQDAHYVSTILGLRNKAVANGQDPEHWNNLIRNYKPTSNPKATLADLYPALDKSNEQVAGDFGQLATTVLGAGALPGVGAAAAEPAASVGAGLLQGAKTGAIAGGVFGAASGGSTALQNDASTSDVTAQALEGGAMGAITGGVLGGGIGLIPFVPKLAGTFKGKTAEEILATPENKLAGLSSEDRKVYFDAQRAQAASAHTAAQGVIDKRGTQLESQIKAAGEKKMTDLNNQTQDLINQSDRASIDEAQSLKPKLIQSMGENSATYRDLIDKEIAPVRNEQVSHADLVKYITERNPENPARATEIASRLGLDTGASISNKSSTVGEIYDQLKGLKQDIGGAAKKGARVFTPDELKTTDAISILSDYLKNEKGINFTEANKFWSQYAPLRDKLIKNIQPFTPKGAESGTFGTFAKDIQGYVNGVKEGKVDFMQATEKLLGTKIGNPETRSALERLTANEKAKFATKLEQENKLSDAKLLREQQAADAKSTLSSTQKVIADKEFEANRQAQTRKNIVKVLGSIVGGGVALEELRRLTGL